LLKEQQELLLRASIVLDLHVQTTKLNIFIPFFLNIGNFYEKNILGDCYFFLLFNSAFSFHWIFSLVK